MSEEMAGIGNLTSLRPVRDPERMAREKATLLWRVLRRQPEMRSGLVRAVRENFLRAVIGSAERCFSGDESVFIPHLKQLLFGADREGPLNRDQLTLRIFVQFQKELGYIQGRQDQFSFDILFQTIELLSLGKNDEQAESTIRQLGNSEAALSHLDRDRLLEYFRAYNLLAKLIKASGNVKVALEKREQLIDEAASQHVDLPLSALDSMFRYCIAQILLSRKFLCRELIELWREEYGFDQDAVDRMLAHIPADCSLLEFRQRYAQAIQSFRSGGDQMELFLLRTLANYFTSWVTNVSEKIPA